MGRSASGHMLWPLPNCKTSCGAPSPRGFRLYCADERAGKLFLVIMAIFEAATGLCLLFLPDLLLHSCRAPCGRSTRHRELDGED